MKTINELAKEVHENAKSKGFYDHLITNESTPSRIALLHSEVSEALEADRENRYCDDVIKPHINVSPQTYIDMYKTLVKGTFEEEMADIVIRVMDMCEWKGIDLQAHIEAKMRYNSLRPHMHGGKKY